MKLKILHQIKGRLRVHILNKYIQTDLDRILCVLNNKPQIKRCKIYYATNDMTVEYTCDKSEVLNLLCSLSPESGDVPEHALNAVTSARELKQQYTAKLIKKVAGHFRDILNGKLGGSDTLKVLSAFRVFFCLVFV